MTRAVMIGAGLSGLVSARSFLAASKAKGVDAQVTVVEALGRAGGNLMSERHEGFLIDGGPDSWVAAKPQGAALCRELGLGDDLIETVPDNRRVYVAHRGGLVPLPEGVVLGTPTRLRPMAATPLLSWPGKLRALFDLVLPATEIPEDVSLGELVAARIGREAVTALVEPLLAGIYAGDAWTLSARATFPQLVEMLRRERSLLKAARDAAPKRHGGYVPPSAFVSLRGGVGQLVDALVASLPAGTVRYSTRVTSVRKGSASPWEVALDSGQVLPADHVVLGVAPTFAASLVREAAPGLAEALDAVPCTSAATVFFAHERRNIPHPLDATGFIVPKREGMRILAGTWVSSKWPGRAPDGMVLMRAFVGGAGHDERARVQEDSIVHMAQTDLCGVMKIRAAPRLTRVYRFLDTSPQPTLGHVARVDAVRSALRRHPGLHVLGSAWNGVGIPDVIALARRAVQDMLARSPK